MKKTYQIILNILNSKNFERSLYYYLSEDFTQNGDSKEFKTKEDALFIFNLMDKEYLNERGFLQCDVEISIEELTWPDDLEEEDVKFEILTSKIIDTAA
jgi:hypothetical protein